MLITKDTLKNFLIEIAKQEQEKSIKQKFQNKDLIINCEFSLQFALALYLRDTFSEKIERIEFESRLYDENNKENKCGKYGSLCRCDLVIYKKDNTRVLIELKYIVENGDEKTSGTSRKSFIKDLKRLNNTNNLKKNYDYTNIDYDERYCIFITDKEAIYKKAESCKNSNDLELFNKTFGNPKSKYHQYWLKDEDNELNIQWNSTKIQCLLINAREINLKELEDEYNKIRKKENPTS